MFSNDVIGSHFTISFRCKYVLIEIRIIVIDCFKSLYSFKASKVRNPLVSMMVLLFINEGA